MPYTVVVPQSVRKELDKLNKKDRKLVDSAIAALGESPLLGKKLKGKYDRFRSYRVWPFRIVYEVLAKKLVVLIIKAGQRESAYK